jgi:hypothetical protein
VTEFKPGDRVRRLNEYKEWTQATVVAVGKQRLLVEYEWTDDVDGTVCAAESCWTIQGTELVPVYPELWINLTPGILSPGAFAYESERRAAERRPSTCYAVVHIASDGTVTLEPCGVSGDVRGAA